MMDNAYSKWINSDQLGEAINSDPSEALITREFDIPHANARYLIFRDNKGITCIVVHFSAYYQIGIWLRPDLRGRGLSRNWLLKSIAGLPKGPLFAIIENTNSASMALFKACGFRQLSLNTSEKSTTIFTMQVS